MNETKPLEEKALTVIEQAKTLPDIWTAQDFDKAGHFALLINDQIKGILSYFKPQKQNLDQAKDVILAEEKRLLKPLKEMLAYLHPRISCYLREERRKKAEAEEKARADARKQAEEELLARAKKAEDAGNQEAARAIIEEPVVLKAVKRVAEIPKVSGISTIEVWGARITDFPSLVKAVASGQAPMNCLLPNDIFLRAEAKATKGASPIPGVKFFSTDSIRKS